MEYDGGIVTYQVVTTGSELDHNYVEEMEEEPVDMVNFYKEQPATQRYLTCKTSAEGLSEIKELKEIILGMKKQMDDQEIRIYQQMDEIKEIVERHETETRELKETIAELRCKIIEEETSVVHNQILKLPNLESNKNLYSNIDAFESWVEKDLDNFRATMIQKRDEGTWPTAEEAIAAYFTKSKFRSFYTKSRAVVGKRTFGQSVFCSLIKEVYDIDGEDSMNNLADKYRKQPTEMA